MTLSIKEAAKLVGVTPATLRNWEKYGLFLAKRKDNGYRYYDSPDIEILKLVKQYMIDENLSSKHMTRILSSHFPDVNSYIHNQEKVTTSNQKNKNEAQISKDKWKSYRSKLGLTLEEVSNAIGISSSYLSKIENNQANVSLDVMTRLAHYYGESLIFFTETNHEYDNQSLIKNGEEVETHLGLIDTKTMQLSNLKNRSMYPTLFIIQPGGKSPEAHTHKGEEFIYVLEGQLDLHLNDNEKFILEEKDSFSFKPDTKHYWENSTDKITRLLWVHCTF